VFVTDVRELRLVLTVPEFDRAVAFYRDALGLTQLADWSTDTARGILLDAGKASIELFDEAQAMLGDELEVGRRVAGPVRLAFAVGDSAEAADRLVAAGAEEIAPPTMTPWGDRNARLATPEGLQLTLFAPG
jgi:methylmalonyl-CoA/ethylmalonyl-CoA epimerase